MINLDEIRAQIRAYPMTQSLFAKKSGVPLRTLSYFLNGGQPNLTTLDKLVKSLPDKKKRSR